MPVYKARLTQDPDGSWVAAAVQLPLCWRRGATRDEALAKLRDEIRYRIEYCPCSGVDDEYVQVELEVAPRSRPGPPVWPAARPSTAAPLAGAAGCPSPPARPAPLPVSSHPVAIRSAPAAAPPTRPQGWRRWDD